MDLVERLYEKLCNLTVTADGEERKLRVYWDVKCLQTGDRWESAFIAAISSSKVVVSVLSKETFSKEGHAHDVAKLEADSNCDNVLLEIEIAMHLQNQNQTTLFPLLVGPLVKAHIGGGVDEMYGDFFEASSLPQALPPIRVEAIDERLQHCLGDKAPESHPVDQLFKKLLALQGHKLKGLRREVVPVLLTRIWHVVNSISFLFSLISWATHHRLSKALSKTFAR